MPGMPLRGEIERRLLVNYRVDPQWLRDRVPPPFRPQTVNGYAVAGICLIRLGAMRPVGFPAWAGLGSENAAHRIAVEWDTPAGPQRGVYIPRRDSDSLVNVAVGGRLFPGEHHRARFTVQESAEHVSVAFAALDGSARVEVSVHVASTLGPSRLFADQESASAFFEAGATGYSDTRHRGTFDGLLLETDAWRVEPVEVEHAASSFFDDRSAFPPGTAELDNALLMRRVPVTWRALPPLSAALTPAAPSV